MTPADLRDSVAMLLVLVGAKRRRPFRVVERIGDTITAPVRGVAYDKESGRWRTAVTTASSLELPTEADAAACKGAHESLCWMFADLKDGDLPRGAEVVRHESDAVRAWSAEGDETRPDGVVLNRSRRRGAVQVAWLLHKRG